MSFYGARRLIPLFIGLLVSILGFKAEVVIRALFLKKLLVDTCPFMERVPVLDFWCPLLWVSKLE